LKAFIKLQANRRIIEEASQRHFFVLIENILKLSMVQLKF
jgi:hypothetical protein